MKIIYKRTKYTLPFKDAVFIIRQIICLFIRRCLRATKRILIHLKKSFPILVFVVLFEILIIPIGIYIKKYSSWIDGIWDLRLFFLTTILITIVGGIINKENSRHLKLIKQRSAYENFKYESDRYITSLVLICDLNISHDIFNKESRSLGQKSHYQICADCFRPFYGF